MATGCCSLVGQSQLRQGEVISPTMTAIVGGGCRHTVPDSLPHMPHKGEHMRKVKVLQLITHLGFGGASDNTLLTVEQLSRAHYEVHLAAGQDYMDWVEQGRQRADAFFLFPDLHR